MKQFRLNTLAMAVTLSLASPSLLAEIRPADNNTKVIGKSGIEIVNIAAPNAQGLSHNTYEKYNVNQKGAVLNNALTHGRSQLAGELERNPHLAQHSASVILNEVVSRNPSTLSGKQEIFGQRADYVLANPNGISCNGCGFINTQRASLVVGKPNVEQGNLTGYQVDNQNSFKATGNVANENLDQLDVVAPRVEISGDVSGARNINVVMGRNQVTRDAQGHLAVTQTNQKAQVLNGKIAGSMHAERIRIHSADDRATLTLENANIQATDAAIKAGNLTAKGKVTKNTQNHHSDGVEGKKVKVVRTSQRQTEQLAKNQINVQNLAVDVTNKLDISSTDITGDKVTLIGGGVNFGTQTTTNRENNVVKQSKGLWYRNETDSSSEQTLHRTTINASDVKLVASKQKITGQAVRIDAQNAGLYAEQGIELKGGTSTNRYSATTDFKRESARLKTGNGSQQSQEQNYVASELNVRNQAVMGSAKNIVLTGTKVAVDGDLFVKSEGKTHFNSQSTTDTFDLNDQHKFWGGLAGSKRVGKAVNQQVQHGSDVTVVGNLRLESDKGAAISGSRVVAQGNGYLVAKQGNLQIDSVTSHKTEQNSHRVGTVFNILKEREQSFTHTISNTGSLVKSNSNLYLSTDKQLNVRGSEVIADQLVDIAAISGVSVVGVENMIYKNTEKAGVNFTAKVDKSKFKFGLTREEAIDSLIKGAMSDNPITEITNDVKDSFSFSKEASVKVGVYKSKTDSQEVNHTASTVSGASATINTNTLNVGGSKVAATEGDLTINANNINTYAQYNQQNTSKKETEASLKLEGKITHKTVSATVTAGVVHKNTQLNASSAQGSQLSAQNDVNLIAKKINHQGTEINAVGNIHQTANQINHLAAMNKQDGRETQFGVALSAGATVDRSKTLTGNINLKVDGKSVNLQESNALATQLNSGQHITINATKLNDQGTQYQAQGDINLTSRQHNLMASHSYSNKDSVSAGVNIGISGSTKDLNTFNLKFSTGAKFQTEGNYEHKEQNAAVSGKNVNIETARLNSQADISAQQNANIVATQGANFSQANHHKAQQGGGFNAEVGVGALVVPAASTAIPSVDVSLGVNGNRGQSNQGSAGTINAKNLIITSPNLNLQGTNIKSQETALNADNITISGLNHQRQNIDVAAGVGVGVGAGKSSLNLKGNLDVKHENSQEHSSSSVNAERLDINAKNLTVVGVTTQSTDLNVNANNVQIVAPQSNVNKTNVSLNGSLKGGLANGQWKPNGGSAGFKVDVVRNRVHANTALKAENANINAKNMLLVGSQVNASNLAGKVDRLTTVSTVNRINEVSVGAFASGGGKPSLYTKKGWRESVKNDWLGGSMAGVKAEVKFNLGVNRQKGTTLSQLSGNNSTLKVNHHNNLNRPGSTVNTKIKVSGHLSTNTKDMIKRAKEDIKNKRTPWIQVNP